MTPPRKLLHDLLYYIREQTRDIDPRAYRLSEAKEQVFRRDSLAGLPGVTFDPEE